MDPRLLAPLALVAALIAVLVVVTTSGTDSQGSGGTATTTPPLTPTTKPKPNSAQGRKTYTVRSGDTLGSIASRTGVSVSVIQQLNPSLNPQALTVGETVKLRR